MAVKDVAVVGGGIGGASIALELLSRPDTKVMLIEARDSIGHSKSASGIIAASLIFKSQSQYWNEPDDPEDVISKLKTLVVNPTPRQVQFAARGARYKLSKDPRAMKASKEKFFDASRKRLEHLVDSYPELCGAIVGPFCCRTGSKARAWMDKTGECDKKPSGWAHSFFTADDWKHASNAEKAKSSGASWKIQGKGTARYNDTARFIMQKDLEGVLWNDDDQGFVRVEDLFPIITKIFEAHKADMKVVLNCKVKSIAKNGKGLLQMNFDTTCGQFPEKRHSTNTIIVSAGANSVNVLADQDELMSEELLPVKGFACATNAQLIGENLRNLGVQHEEKSHYIRAQKNGGVRYGFGKEFGGLDDEVAQIDPHYEETWTHKDTGIGATALGRKVMAQTDVKKLAGIRPLSALGNFPLIKTYPKWPGLILCTGYGWHGFVMSWKSAQIAADLAVTGSVNEPDWAFAVEGYSGCSWMSPSCWAWYSWVALAAVILILVGVCCYFVCGGSKSPAPVE